MSAPTDTNEELSPIKQALLEIRRLREKLARYEGSPSVEIAIVGMGCRFPGDINDPDTLWSRLEQGFDAIEEIPKDRWDIDAHYDPDPSVPGKMSTRWGGFLRGIDQFDPEFFDVSAREAASLDPQQRLLMEVSWAALENAGIPPSSLFGSNAGVFTGIGSFDYPTLEAQSCDPIVPYFATGASHSVASGRLSYVLGAHGPCLSIDTACSASLVAVHMACQSLRLNECSLALAGGVNVLLLPEMFVDLSSGRMLAADGRCKSFDAAADGYVRAEGCGMVVLKRLRDAIDDGDRIVAVVRGSAINQNGRSAGPRAPNGPAQVAVIRKALRDARLQPEDVGYVEAHGAGTRVGDPVEAHALGEALGQGREKSRPLLIGTIKTNLGNLESAAGIAGLIKATLCLQNGAIPKSLHFNEPNPGISWDEIRLEVVGEMTAWSVQGGSRIAGVSAFGLSGTNAHVLLEEAPTAEFVPDANDRPIHLLTLSAKSDHALRKVCENYLARLNNGSGERLADIAFSANTGRDHFAHRAALLGNDTREVARDLDALANGRTLEFGYHGTPAGSAAPEICFLFPGQRAVYPGGRQLFETQPTFRRALQRCDAALAGILDRPISEIIFSSAPQPRVAEPAFVAFEFALSELWRSWGVTPGATMGHGLGEYAAAIVAGVLSPEDGLRLVAEHGRLIEEHCAPGRAVAVREDSLAEPASSELTSFAGSLEHRTPEIPLFSNLSGNFFAPGEGPTHVYWAHRARRPIRFQQGIGAAVDQGYRVFLEVGPTATLASPATERLDTYEGCLALASFKRSADDWNQILDTLARLYVAGVSIDWKGFDRDYSRRKLVLPTYPFQRKRHWFSAAAMPNAKNPASSRAARGSAADVI
jgi:acyl transferase domain-containing protein